jgi:hypothetical protein
MPHEKSQAQSRTRNFRQRLEIERRVLSVVNAQKACPELLGLTKDSISRWRKDAKARMNEPCADRIVSILTMIARETGTISDNSRLIVSGGVPTARTSDLLVALGSELDQSL